MCKYNCCSLPVHQPHPYPLPQYPCLLYTSDIKDRIVLTLAGNYIDYDLKRKVVEYNKSGDTYRIVVKEYSTYNTSEDYTLGVKQLNNDIISGGMPDLSLIHIWHGSCSAPMMWWE